MSTPPSIACSLFILALLSSPGAHADEPEASASAAPRYTFSWPLNDSAPAPRGGSSRGPATTPDTAESAAWHALRAGGISAFERDRRAILAMAGEYRVTFDFLEVETFKPAAARDRPYQSWGTERVYIDQDMGNFISLVHILDMRVIQKDGSISEPMVTKHWRQDWQYEPKQLIEFKGYDRWQRRDVARGERAGHWSQTVDQVDESPRYAGIGRWEHSASFSTWISAQTWRPLPRRELTVRKDYQVLEGTNRITVTAAGWLQEENNLKTVLTPDRRPDPSQPHLAREYGVARYERLRDADFAAADRYFERTRQFWDDVHAAWVDLYGRHPQLTLPVTDGQADPTDRLFDHADQLAAGHVPQVPAAEVIRESLQGIGNPPSATAPRPAPP